MRLADFYGDFLSFSFRGVNSADMGIVRVSDGSRFTTNLFPPSRESIIAVEGRSESFVADIWHEPRTFDLEFVFDDVTELGLRRLRTWLRNDVMGELFFDETDYKAYEVRVTNEVRLNFVPFDDKKTVRYAPTGGDVTPRIYKGEGNVTFKAYFPYAKNRYDRINSGNIEQWVAAAGIPVSGTTNYDTLNAAGSATLFNAGEITTPLDIEFKVVNNTGYQSFQLREDGDLIGQIVLDLSKLSVGTTYIIDSYRKIVRQKNSNKEHSIAHAAGDYLFLPQSINPLSERVHNHVLTTSPTGYVGSTGGKIEILDTGIQYDYLYY